MTVRVFIAWVTLALLVVSTLPSFAQDRSVQRFDRGLLWKLEKPGQPVSYLFGTIHVPDERVLKFSSAVLSAFQSAEQVATEIAMDMGNLQKLVSAMAYTDGRTLQGVTGRQLYGQLAALLAKLGVPDNLAERLKPWAAMSLLIVPPRADAVPMDMVLYQAAGQAGKMQASLETIDEQVALFEGVSLEQQLQMLREVIENFGKVTELTHKMIHAYLDRNLGELNAISSNDELLSTEEARRFNREFRSRMIEQRDVVMAGRMAPMLERTATFFAVGALHLPGESGLLALLEQRGYRVNRADD